jgi:hypothetical protein
MNLVAASKRTPHIYFASQDHIAIYDTPTGEGSMSRLNKKRRLNDRLNLMDLRAIYFLIMYILHFDRGLMSQPFTITNMYVGEIGGEEVLVTADDSGHVVIYFHCQQLFSPSSLSKTAPVRMGNPHSF